MTIKEKIYSCLKEIEPRVAYRDTDIDKLPRFSFSLVSNNSLKFSNKRHSKHVTYQVDYYSQRPLNVENDTILLRVIEDLERLKLICTDWLEIDEIDTEANTGFYRYSLEVCGYE